MHTLDTTTWQPFRIGDLFSVEKGTRLTKTQMLEGDIAFIGASAMNNGITARIANKEHVFNAGAITVCYNGSVGESFYQTEPFWASDDVNVLIPKENMSDESCLFLLPILREAGRRYGFTNKWRQEVMQNDFIPLPVDADGVPDWQFMSGYMTGILQESSSFVDDLRKVNLHGKHIDSSAWKPFAIADLFVVQKGTRLTRANMIPGDLPFIGATLENNGITAHIGNREHVHLGGTLTVAYNGQKAMGKAFWQPKQFWASDDVNVLYPKFELNEQIALFLQPIFWEASRAFSYDDKWNQKAMEQTTIMLPVTQDGSPDWKYMHSVMEHIIREADAAIDQLEEL